MKQSYKIQSTFFEKLKIKYNLMRISKLPQRDQQKLQQLADSEDSASNQRKQINQSQQLQAFSKIKYFDKLRCHELKVVFSFLTLRDLLKMRLCNQYLSKFIISILPDKKQKLQEEYEMMEQRLTEKQQEVEKRADEFKKVNSLLFESELQISYLGLVNLGELRSLRKPPEQVIRIVSAILKILKVKHNPNNAWDVYKVQSQDVSRFYQQLIKLDPRSFDKSYIKFVDELQDIDINSFDGQQFEAAVIYLKYLRKIQEWLQLDLVQDLQIQAQVQRRLPILKGYVECLGHMIRNNTQNES